MKKTVILPLLLTLSLSAQEYTKSDRLNDMRDMAAAMTSIQRFFLQQRKISSRRIIKAIRCY